MYYSFDFFSYLYQQTSIPSISHDNRLIFLTCCRKVEVDRMMDVPHLQGVGEGHSSGRKRKRTPRATSAPLVEVVEGVDLNNNAPEVEQVQSSNAVQPNDDNELLGGIGDGEDQNMGDGSEDRDFGDGSEDP